MPADTPKALFAIIMWQPWRISKACLHYLIRLLTLHIASLRSRTINLLVLLLSLLLLSFTLVLFIKSHSSNTLKHNSPIQLKQETVLSLEEKREISTRFSLPLHHGNPAAGLAPTVVKKIHFMYKSFQVEGHFKSLLSSWRKVYPDYQIYFWTDAEIDLLVSRLYPAWQYMYYRQLSNYMERSDTARAFILHAMGGWYADLDTGCLSRADGYASRHALILPLEPYLHALNHFHMRRLVSNAIMYSVPQHPFWMFYLQQLRQSLVGKKPRKSTLQAAETTGPVPLTEAALMFQQAHQGEGCPGPWCPHLPPPVHFLPFYDNSTMALRHRFRYLCTRLQLERLFDTVEFQDECRRFRQHDFANPPLNPADSHTYHEFAHLNQKKKDARVKADVKMWNLKLVHGRELVGEIDRLKS